MKSSSYPWETVAHVYVFAISVFCICYSFLFFYWLGKAHIQKRIYTCIAYITMDPNIGKICICGGIVFAHTYTKFVCFFSETLTRAIKYREQMVRLLRNAERTYNLKNKNQIKMNTTNFLLEQKKKQHFFPMLT